MSWQLCGSGHPITDVVRQPEGRPRERLLRDCGGETRTGTGLWRRHSRQVLWAPWSPGRCVTYLPGKFPLSSWRIRCRQRRTLAAAYRRKFDIPVGGGDGERWQDYDKGHDRRCPVRGTAASRRRRTSTTTSTKAADCVLNQPQHPDRGGRDGHEPPGEPCPSSSSMTP